MRNIRRTLENIANTSITLVAVATILYGANMAAEQSIKNDEKFYAEKQKKEQVISYAGPDMPVEFDADAEYVRVSDLISRDYSTKGERK